VEIMDFGGFSAPGSGSKPTDANGRVEFTVVSGEHRIRVVAADFITYEGSFETLPNENMHMEVVRMRLKPGATATGAPGGAPVPAVRLKIPPDAKKEFEQASKAMEKNNYKEAAEHFRAATQKYPDYDLAYNGLGIALLNEKDAAGAKEALEHAIKITPDFPAAQRSIARIYLAQRDWKNADSALKKSLQNEPSNGWALMNAAYAELELELFAEAVANAQKVHPAPHAGLENAHYIAGVALQQMGKPTEARDEFNLYLKEAPTGPNAARAQQAIAHLQDPKQ